MRDDDDPAACAEVVRDGLRVAAVAAAFQAVEQQQGRGVGRLRQGFPVGVGHPAGSGGLAVGHGQLAADRGAIGGLVREQPGAGPVEIDEIGVGSFNAIAYEGNAVVLREQRGVDRLGIASGQPGGNRACLLYTSDAADE